MKEPAIVVKNLSKDFMLPHLRRSSVKNRVLGIFGAAQTIELQRVLDDINLTVDKGEFLGIVGRNGSGKSTLMKIIAGIYTPTNGAVEVRGRLVPFIELGVGFHPELTGRENVYLNAALLGFSVREVDAMYDDIVSFAELPESMDQKFKYYSSGMQVRLAFSLATRARSEILLIDEVLAVGDVAFRHKCNDYFRWLKDQGTTIVLVTHDMDPIREFCDRAILIEGGRIAAAGEPEEVAAEYTRTVDQ